MSGFRRRPSWSHFPERRKKAPPPKSGIRVARAVGTTWWGRRWIEALEAFSADFTARLGRGRTYARAGRVHDLSVASGRVKAFVTGSRPRPYAVEVRLDVLSEKSWVKAIAAMSESAAFSARLLAGEMPEGVDEAFRDCGGPLFPNDASGLASTCSCPDWANPCKHVSAVLYVLGDAFDRDPFLLFEVRGRSKVAVLESLRRARSESDAPRAARKPPRRARAARPEPARPIDAAAYETFGASLAELRFLFDAPPARAAVLRQLGSPPRWSSAPTLAERLAPAVAMAAELARRMAVGGTDSAEDGSTEEVRIP